MKIYSIYQIIYQLFSDNIKIPFFNKLGILIKPSNLNFSITGYCNAQCVMCNVWMNPDERAEEITVQELNKLLDTEYFSNLKHIGIAGGEPLLRKDTSKFIKSLMERKKLISITLSTHAFHTEMLETLVKEVTENNKYNTRFRLAISLDGVDEVHDVVRGIHGAFEKTWRSILLFKENKNVDVELGCTISKYNIDDLYNLFHLAKKNNINIRFRISTIVNRLNNHSVQHEMEFDDFQEYKLIEFFKKISRDKFFPLERRMFYESAAVSLIEKKERSQVCRTKYEGSFIDEKGGVHHCAVFESKFSGTNNDIVNLLDKKHILRSRTKMQDTGCNGCLHDYRTVMGLKDILRFLFINSKMNQIIFLLRNIIKSYI